MASKPLTGITGKLSRRNLAPPSLSTRLSSNTRSRFYHTVPNVDLREYSRDNVSLQVVSFVTRQLMENTGRGLIDVTDFRNERTNSPERKRTTRNSSVRLVLSSNKMYVNVQTSSLSSLILMIFPFSSLSRVSAWNSKYEHIRLSFFSSRNRRCPVN